MSIIDSLVSAKFISRNQVQDAQRFKGEGYVSLLEAILNLPGVDEHMVCCHVALLLDIEFTDMDDEEPSSELLALIPAKLIKRYNILPLSHDEEGLRVAMADPLNIIVKDDLESVTALTIIPVIASPAKIRHKIENCMDEDRLDSVLENITEFSQKKIPLDDEMLHSKCAILNADQSPVVNLVNNIISDASVLKSSDIHIEPLEDIVEIRYRIDGILKVRLSIPKQVHKHLVSRIKIMADLDISECRRPQDGRIGFHIEGQHINLRISTIPTVHGEKIVLRILDSKQMAVDIDRLGLNTEHLASFKRMIKQPQGMILVCGPTGSGKTSTLYSVIKTIKSKEKNIVTIEDPVEQTIEGINQTQVNERIGLTFASGLRTILRQDPNCILVGEIRDRETADIAFRSSLTGHLVLSTLHTNCSISAVTRLKDIGIEPFLICTSLLGIVAQRLIRINCEKCRGPYQPLDLLLEKYHNYFVSTNGNTRFYKGQGCPQCDYTGYQGRMAVFELLLFDSTLRQMINAQSCEETIRAAVRKTGFTTLIEQALSRVAEGMTTLEEVESVIGNYNYEDQHQAPVVRSVQGEDTPPSDPNVTIKEDLNKFIIQLNDLL